MKLPVSSHHQHPWRVRSLAHDFELLDVWEIPVKREPGDKRSFRDFLEMVHANGTESEHPITRALVDLRVQIGRALGWDDRQHHLPIPGCTETSLSARLDEVDAKHNKASEFAPLVTPIVELRAVYVFEDEALFELNNDTAHAMMHLSWARAADPTTRPQLAVYVKKRGFMSGMYFKLITPFRLLVVYPTWTRNIAKAWSKALMSDISYATPSSYAR